jgi:hypothetical protein
MEINEETNRSVLAQLTESPLEADAFDCGFNLDDSTLVSIKVKEHDHFYYTLHPSNIEGTPWEVRESPGPLFHGAETSRFGTLDAAIAYIGDWQGRVAAQLHIRSEELPESQ